MTSTPYPATDPGFAAQPVAELLASVDDLISRIRLCFGLARDDFDREVQPLVTGYARYVHLLPATADNYFSTPGGLLRLGLEVAFFSLQGTDAHIFSGRSTIAARRQLEPRWRLATFIGGLCCEAHRVLSHMLVTDGAGNEWPAFLLPLADWLQANGIERYYLRWRPHAVESRGLGVFTLPRVVPAATMQSLSMDSGAILPHLLVSLSGMPLYRHDNVLDSLVRRSLALVVDRNLQANADRYGVPQFGSHLERYLVDAMRRLAADRPSWFPNREKSRAWLGPEGLFLAWPQSAADIQALLEADQLAGIPKAPETVLELLLAAGVLQGHPEGGAIWHILPPDARAAIEAIKLSSPAILLAGLDGAPAPLSEPLVCRPDATRAAPSPAGRGRPAAGGQLSLLEPVGESKAPPSPARMAEVASAVVPAPPAPRFKLIAPMRLNPAVRDALASIVDTLNGPGTGAAAAAISTGLFVPLRELERRGIQPALAARALSDVGLLVHRDRDRPTTVTQDFAGKPTVGLVLVPGCIEGFEIQAFSPPVAAEP